MRFATLIGGLLAFAFVAGSAVAQGVYKDTKLGFSFKPPKDYKAIPVDPLEHTVIAKYQASQMDYGGTQGNAGYNSLLLLSFYPKGRFSLVAVNVEGGDVTTKGDPDEPAAQDPLAEFVTQLRDVRFSKYECTKQKPIKVDNAPAVELTFEIKDATANDRLAYYCLVLQQDDGLYEFEGTSVPQRFAKVSADFATAAKSFKRIDRVDDKAKESQVSQMDEQDRFLQTQIDKLPPGWSHMRTKRYLFLYDAEKGFVQELADRIEAMRDQYEKDFPPDHPITAVSIVRVCGNWDEYTGYGGPQGTGGYWNWVARELVVFNLAPHIETLSIINHEAFHQYIYYFYGQLSPHSWYNEGTGDYYAGAKLTKSNKIESFGDPPGGIARLGFIKDGARLLEAGKSKAEGAAAPLKDVMHFHQSEYYGNAGYNGLLCYAEGWSIIHFLRQGKRLDAKWQKILPDYLKNLVTAREQVAKETMEKAIAKADKEEPGSSSKLSQDIKDWYERVDENKVQDRTFDSTFSDWTDADWKAFQDAWMKYVEKL